MRHCVTCLRQTGTLCGILADAAERIAGSEPLSSFAGVPAQSIIASEGDPVDHVYVVCAGWVVKEVRRDHAGKRVISILLPGDAISVHALVAEKSPFAARALTDVRLRKIDRGTFLDLIMKDRETLLQVGKLAISEALNVLRRLSATSAKDDSAMSRTAGFLAELFERLSRRGTINLSNVPFPPKQSDVASYLGLTTVHVSRVFSKLKEMNVVTLHRGYISIQNYGELKRLQNSTAEAAER